MSILTGSLLSSMVDIGHRTGLFAAAAEGPATSEQLAARAGLCERYVREWLGAVTTGGIVDTTLCRSARRTGRADSDPQVTNAAPAITEASSLARRTCRPGHECHCCGGLGARYEPRPGAPVCCGVALALDVSQALGELAISDPDNIHATYVPVRPVVAPAHDGAS